MGAILEDINGKMDRMIEAMSALASREEARQIDQKVDAIAADLKIVKAAVTDVSSQMNGIDHRLTALEA